jgi:hypothetical protein
VGAELERGFLQMPRRPASNSGSLGAQSGEGEGEEWRGRCGGLIGAARGRNGWAFTGIEEEKLRGGNGPRRDLRSREEDDDLALTCGARCQ